jgi:thioredoxin 1
MKNKLYLGLLGLISLHGACLAEMMDDNGMSNSMMESGQSWGDYLGMKDSMMRRTRSKTYDNGNGMKYKRHKHKHKMFGMMGDSNNIMDLDMMEMKGNRTRMDELNHMIAKSDKDVVVLAFYLRKCPPCKMLLKDIRHIAADYGDDVDFIKINSEDNPMIAQEYGVQEHPTIIILRNNMVVNRMGGYFTTMTGEKKGKDMLREKIDDALSQ